MTLLFTPILGTVAAARQCSPEQGQIYINDGRYRDAIREFTCVIEAQPTEVEGYRARIEAELLLGRYSDGVRDYARVTAFVQSVHPDAEATIASRLRGQACAMPDDIPALTGASFAEWWFFDYPAAIHLLNDLLVLRPMMFMRIFSADRVVCSKRQHAPKASANVEDAGPVISVNACRRGS